MNVSNISISKFSPLRTPALKTSHKKQSVYDYTSETESTVSVVTQDIHKLVKAVRQKLKDPSDTDHMCSDSDFISQSKIQDRKNRQIAKNKKVPSVDSGLSGSETEDPEAVPKRKFKTPNSVSQKNKTESNSKLVMSKKNGKSPAKRQRGDSLSSLSSDPSSDSEDSIEEKSRKIKGGNSKNANVSSNSEMSSSKHKQLKGNNSKMSGSSSESSDSEASGKYKKTIKGNNSKNSSSPSESSDSEVNRNKNSTIKGGNSRPSVKRERSISSSSLPTSSDEESQSILKSPKKKIKTKHEEIKKKPLKTTDTSDSSDSESDTSSAINTKFSSTVNTSLGSKKGQSVTKSPKPTIKTKPDGKKKQVKATDTSESSDISDSESDVSSNSNLSSKKGPSNLKSSKETMKTKPDNVKNNQTKSSDTSDSPVSSDSESDASSVINTKSKVRVNTSLSLKTSQSILKTPTETIKTKPDGKKKQVNTTDTSDSSNSESDASSVNTSQTSKKGQPVQKSKETIKTKPEGKRKQVNSSDTSDSSDSESDASSIIDMKSSSGGSVDTSQSSKKGQSVTQSPKETMKTKHDGKKKQVNTTDMSDSSVSSDSESDASSIIDMKSSSGVSVNTSQTSKKGQPVGKSPKETIKTKPDRKRKQVNTTDTSDSSDSESDASSVIDVKSSSGVSANTSLGARKDKTSDEMREIDRMFSDSDSSDSSMEQTPRKKQASTSWSSAYNEKDQKNKGKSPKKSANKNQLRYKIPNDFEIDTSSDCLTSKDIKGKQLWLIMAPDDVDISSFHGQRTNMTGISNVSIEADEVDKQYEVITQPYDKNEVKTFNSVTLKTSGEQEYVVGPEISGQIQIMNWLPHMPPVQLTKSKPQRHSIPDNLDYKLQPFGSVSPERHEDGDTTIETPSKHKKKKKKKDKKSRS